MLACVCLGERAGGREGREGQREGQREEQREGQREGGGGGSEGGSVWERVSGGRREEKEREKPLRESGLSSRVAILRTVSREFGVSVTMLHARHVISDHRTEVHSLRRRAQTWRRPASS